MKKNIVIVLLSVIFLAFPTYAKSDLQLGLGLPVFNFSGENFDSGNSSLLIINLSNHNFIGEEERIGFAETVSFSPLTTDVFNQFPGFNFSAFVGPSFRFPVSGINDFILSTGFKYFFTYSRNVQEYPEDVDIKNLIVVGTKKYSAYSISIDLQMKFFANRLFSIAFGMPASIGIGSEDYTQNVKDSNPNSVYKTLSSKSGLESFFEFGFPYFMLSLNL